MATRSGARIYRGQTRRLAKGACPTCHRVITLTKNNRRRPHNDQDGNRCTGSGVGWGRVHTRNCEDCGRWTKTRRDGSLIKHRIEADNPLAPYCEAA